MEVTDMKQQLQKLLKGIFGVTVEPQNIKSCFKGTSYDITFDVCGTNYKLMLGYGIYGWHGQLKTHGIILSKLSSRQAQETYYSLLDKDAAVAA